MAGEPADAALRLFPRAGRAIIRQVASSDGGITVVREPAFGRYSFRVTVPPGTSAALALRLSYADSPPSVLAWREPALVAYRKQLATFLAAVAGLIAAAAAVTGGLAAMTGHAAPRWAALTLVGVFVLWLSMIGLFDHGWTTSVGGPYGFMALISGLSLAAAVRLTEAVAPLSDLWPWAERYRRWGLLGLVALSFLAFVGVPAAAFLVDVLLVFGVAGLAAYLVRRGMTGSRPARVLAPSATVFALVTLGSAIAVLGGFQGNPIAGEIVGGFAAAGAVLVALAVAAGEGLGLMGPRLAPDAVLAAAPRLVPKPEQAPAPPPMPRSVPADEATAAALIAIGASHQGVYELDFRTDTLHLSAEAAALIGFTRGAPGDPAFRLDRARSCRGPGHLQGCALRLSRPSGPGVPHRIPRAQRKRSLSVVRTARDHDGRGRAGRPLPGPDGRRDDAQGSRSGRHRSHVARSADGARQPRRADGGTGAASIATAQDVAFAILDIDRFKAIHASLGDAGADAVLRHVADRLTKHFEGKAEVFRFGGDAFALLVGRTRPSPMRSVPNWSNCARRRLSRTAARFLRRPVSASLSGTMARSRWICCAMPNWR